MLCGRGSCSQALYEKLRENPDLLNGQPIAVNFKNNIDATPTADFYEVKKEMEEQLSGSDVLKILINDNQTAIDLVMQQLAINDSLHRVATANWTVLEAERAELKTQLYSLLAAKENLLALLTDERNMVAEQIKQQNEIIAAAAETRLLNEKIINSIYLSTAARGDFDFDVESLQQISDIANQCPITGGQAVYVARSLYETIEPTIYDDEAICQAIGISQKTEEPICATDFDIVPNPSKGIVSFVLNKPQDATILIYDALGRQVAQYKLNNESSITTFDLSYLASGIYFIQLQNQQNNSQIQKLSLIH